MTFPRNIVITVALDSFKSDKKALMPNHCGPGFKEHDVSYFNEGGGSNGRGVASPSHQLQKKKKKSFFVKAEHVVVLSQ